MEVTHKMVSTNITIEEFNEVMVEVVPYMFSKGLLTSPSMYCFLNYAFKMVKDNVQQRRKRGIRGINEETRVEAIGITNAQPNANSTSVFENRPKPGISTSDELFEQYTRRRRDYDGTDDPREESN